MTKICKKPAEKRLFKGITAHARMLGVNRSHLWRVLTGERESKPLMQRYGSLLKQENGAAGKVTTLITGEQRAENKSKFALVN